MEEEYAPSAAAELIERRRLSRGVSVRRAAKRAELSEGRWRQIAKGYQQAARGVRVPVNAPVETLARMASAVELHSDELDVVGAHEVAALVREQAIAKLRHPLHGPAGGTSVSLLSDEVLLEELARRLRRGSDAQRDLVLQRFGHAPAVDDLDADLDGGPTTDLTVDEVEQALREADPSGQRDRGRSGQR